MKLPRVGQTIYIGYGRPDSKCFVVRRERVPGHDLKHSALFTVLCGGYYRKYQLYSNGAKLHATHMEFFRFTRWHYSRRKAVSHAGRITHYRELERKQSWSQLCELERTQAWKRLYESVTKRAIALRDVMPDELSYYPDTRPECPICKLENARMMPFEIHHSRSDKESFVTMTFAKERQPGPKTLELKFFDRHTLQGMVGSDLEINGDKEDE